MSGTATDLTETTKRQALAADPEASAWVSANAGSGKTHVLINRVMRLLLSGTPPERILCLTFTKAAAAEMSGRLYKKLGEWALLGEDALRKAIEDLEGAPPDAARVLAARLLFARAIETPGGLKIQTIHAFCERLLGRFPLEAQVPPHFEIMDERTVADLMAEAQADVLTVIGGGEAPADLTRAFEIVSGQVGEYGFDDLFREMVGARARLAEWIERSGGAVAAGRSVFERLGIDPSLTEDGVIDEALKAIPRPEITEAIPHLQAGKPTDVKTGEGLASTLTSRAADEAYGFYRDVFFTKSGDPKKFPRSIVTKGVYETYPPLLDLLEREQERMIDVDRQLRSVRVATSTAALLVLAEALLAAFAQLKRQHGYLDYDDLILRSRDLLQRGSAAAWVLYKLDGGLDHILVDEAQDTSPHQWEVVQALADEFLSGEGAREMTRTIFAVGDEKQSIFSFQGADPARFAEMRTYFGSRVQEAGKSWHPVDLLMSFRSTPDVLNAVDRVFDMDGAARGLNADHEPPTHFAMRDLDAGRVEIWPLMEPEEAEEDRPWDAPLDYPSAGSPSSRLAHKIAGQVAEWLATHEELAGCGRPIRPGDILILVRRRNEFVDEVIRALKARDVPVAGTDRMVLTEQIAVMDLIAAGAFALMPEDDLTLATVLKSPLVGVSEEALFDLAYHRTGSLWQALGSRAGEPAFAGAYGLLMRLLARVDRVRPYELFADLLVREGGRKRLRARLGPDVDDPVDEFLNLALNFEQTHAPSMQGFLHWIEAGEAQVKREMGEGRDEVRVMTVHGSKGLEAEIVFMPDTCGVPGGQHDPRLIPDGRGDDATLLFPGRVANDDPVSAAARAARREEAMNEYRRLLYVAMTRAKDRLYVGGYIGERAAAEGCWYNMIAESLIPHAQELTDPDGKIFWRIEGEQKQIVAAEKEPVSEGELAPLPDWAHRPPPPEPTPPRPMVPSHLVEDGEEPAAASPLRRGEADPYKRGRLIHLLLQSLPDVAPAHRREQARRFLSEPGHALAETAQQDIADAALSVLEDETFAALFGPGSRAEVPLVGRVQKDGREIFLSGQIDRLVVTEAEVLVVDFKTNRPPPVTLEAVSDSYLAQLAGYRTLLQSIYPEKAIRTGLLWTDGPRLMEIPAEMLDKSINIKQA